MEGAGQIFPSKQDPYLAAACVGWPGAEGLVPPPRGLARWQRGSTRVLPAERWGCPAAGWAHATQLCPQPSVRLSRNGGSLHGWGTNHQGGLSYLGLARAWGVSEHWARAAGSWHLGPPVLGSHRRGLRLFKLLSERREQRKRNQAEDVSLTTYLMQ